MLGAAGGKQKGTEGYFVEPTVFSHVEDHFKIAKEASSDYSVF